MIKKTEVKAECHEKEGKREQTIVYEVGFCDWK
jgi:hypothetical protein